MSLTRKFLESLSTFAEISLKTSQNSTKATHEFGNFLFAAFEYGKSHSQLSDEDYKTVNSLLVNNLPDIEHCFENLIEDFHYNDISTYLIYRSGIEFVFSVSERITKNSGEKICLKSQEVVDTVEELDERISGYWTAPADPLGAIPSTVDLKGVPDTHIWWACFKLLKS